MEQCKHWAFSERECNNKKIDNVTSFIADFNVSLILPDFQSHNHVEAGGIFVVDVTLFSYRLIAHIWILKGNSRNFQFMLKQY